MWHSILAIGVSRGTGPWHKLSCLTAAYFVAEKLLGGGETAVLGWGGEFGAKPKGECECITSKMA